MSEQDGPSIEIRRYCNDCKWCRSESYTCQGDSGSSVYCTHEKACHDQKPRHIGDTTWRTPNWCPFAITDYARLAVELADALLKIKCVKVNVARLWHAVVKGQYDARELVGDETLAMKTKLFGDEWPTDPGPSRHHGHEADFIDPRDEKIKQLAADLADSEAKRKALYELNNDKVAECIKLAAELEHEKAQSVERHITILAKSAALTSCSNDCKNLTAQRDKLASAISDTIERIDELMARDGGPTWHDAKRYVAGELRWWVADLRARAAFANVKPDPRAVVAGDALSTSIAIFIRKCEVHLLDEQSKPLPDNSLIDTLAEGIRLAREYTQAMKRGLDITLNAAAPATSQRHERCTKCGELVSDWVDPDWAEGRVCRQCETKHDAVAAAQEKKC